MSSICQSRDKQIDQFVLQYFQKKPYQFLATAICLSFENVLLFTIIFVLLLY